MNNHSNLSPSARHRWQLCPASVKACEKYPSGKSSPSSIDGTRTHSLLEHCLKNNVPPEKFIGAMFSDEHGKYAIQRDRAERVKVAVDYVALRLTELPEGTTVLTETQANPKNLVGRDDMAGTVDVILMNDVFVEIIDYKDGVNPVLVVDNPQCELYAVGVLAGNRPFERVRMTIIQPKMAMFKKQPITWHERPASDFYDIVVPTVVAEAEATDNPDAPFWPGEVQCKYCPNAGNCAAFQTYSLHSAGIAFGPTDVAKEAANKDPGNMTDEQLREIIESAPLLRKMIESAEAEALARIQTGHVIAGLKAVKGPGRRQWKFPEDDTANKLIRMGVPKSVVWNTSLISPAQIEKVHWLKRDGTDKQLSQRQLETVTNHLVTKTEGRLTVVSEADNRPAVDFAPIGEMFQPTELPDWMK